MRGVPSQGGPPYCMAAPGVLAIRRPEGRGGGGRREPTTGPAGAEILLIFNVLRHSQYGDPPAEGSKV